jgi:hypothetical protein
MEIICNGRDALGQAEGSTVCLDKKPHVPHQLSEAIYRVGDRVVSGINGDLGTVTLPVRAVQPGNRIYVRWDGRLMSSGYRTDCLEAARLRKA